MESKILKGNYRFGPFLFCCLALIFMTATGPLASAVSTKDSTAPNSDTKSVYTMGVVPFQPVTSLEEIFSPIAAELGKALGREIHFSSSSTMDGFTEKLQNREYDIAYINPFDYVQYASKAGYLPLVTRDEKLYAAFLVLKDSSLRKAADLKGKTVGLPPKVAAIAYLARIALQNAGLKPGGNVILKNFSSQQSCLQQLQIGNLDVCASGIPVMLAFQRETKVEFRSLMESPQIPQALFVVHSRIPKKDQKIMESILLSDNLASGNQKARAFLEGEHKDGRYFQAVKKSEYDVVRRYLNMIKD